MTENHAKLSASSAERWMACPGSVRMCEGKVSRTSKYAEEGTTAHEYAARLLRMETTYSDLAKDGVTQEMLDAIRLYVETVLKLGGVTYVETRVTLSDDAWGTADAIVVKDDVLHVLDLKYGAGKVVEVQDNPQVIFYGLAALNSLEALHLSEIKCWIIQPRAEHPDGPVRSMTLDLLDAQEWANKFGVAIDTTRDPNAPLCKGSHCRWCPALTDCPEQGTLKITDVTQDLRRPINLPEVNSLTTLQISRVLENLPVLETWASALRSHAMELAGSGTEIPGFKLVAGRSTRSWADEEAAQRFLEKTLGEGHLCWERKLVSPAVAEKRKIKIPDSLISRSQPKPALVPLNDKRPPFKPDVSTMFDVINEE
jgi:hypothetical protein